MQEFLGLCSMQTAAAFSVFNLAGLILNMQCQKLRLIYCTFLLPIGKEGSNRELKWGQYGVEPLVNDSIYLSASDVLGVFVWSVPFMYIYILCIYYIYIYYVCMYICIYEANQP